MTFNYKVEDVAAAQLLEAVLWYDENREGLGDELILCFEEALSIICGNPFFEVRYRDLRLYNIRRFPYQIIYKIENDEIIVIAFFHAKRNPKSWKKL